MYKKLNYIAWRNVFHEMVKGEHENVTGSDPMDPTLYSYRNDAKGAGDYTNCPWWKGQLVAKSKFPVDELPTNDDGDLIIPEWVYNYFSVHGTRPWTLNITGTMIPGDAEFFWSQWIDGRVPRISRAHNKWAWPLVNSDDYPDCKYKTYLLDNSAVPAKKFADWFINQGGFVFNSDGTPNIPESLGEPKCGWNAKDFSYASGYPEGIFGMQYGSGKSAGSISPYLTDDNSGGNWWRHKEMSYNRDVSMWLPHIFMPSVREQGKKEYFGFTATNPGDDFSTMEWDGLDFEAMASQNPGWAGIVPDGTLNSLWFRSKNTNGFGAMKKHGLQDSQGLVDTEAVLLSKVWRPRQEKKGTAIDIFHQESACDPNWTPPQDDDDEDADDSDDDSAATIYNLSVPLLLMAFLFHN